MVITSKYIHCNVELADLDLCQIVKHEIILSMIVVILVLRQPPSVSTCFTLGLDNNNSAMVGCGDGTLNI